MGKQASEIGEYANTAQQYVEQKVKGKLLEHILGCAETAEKLAKKFNCDQDKAAAAAYLHDVVKPMAYPEQVACARSLGMPQVKIESYLPPVFHGPLAALLVRKELHLEDRDILEAIECHSSGCAGMGEIAKVVFIADFIEFSRVFPGAKELRSHGAVTLDELALAILTRKLEHLIQERRPIDTRAIGFWNELTRIRR